MCKILTMTRCVVCAGHKRKSNNSDSGSESVNGSTTPVSQKKPRLFFTEEQKLALHEAYAADPYPNQAAIERLAGDIGVGVKTVVNWFHNHRMRAKQQHVNSSSSSSGSDPGTASAHSLSARLKTDINAVAGTATGDQPTTVDGPPDVTVDHPGCQAVGDVLGSEAVTTARTRVKSCSAASRRKRAKPHRLSTGTVLDRTEQPDTVNRQQDMDTSRDEAGQHVDLACTLSTADCLTVESSGNWIDAERERNIERLQRNLEQEPAVDWEF